MKKFVLKKLELENFKGQSRVFEPFADRTCVFAKNKTGKTTLYKALCWLFTSYTDAINVKNHELFDTTKELTPDTPKACVKATFDVDGIEYVVEKKATAKFSRKRSSNEWVKDSSDSYELFIDEIHTSASDFNDWLSAQIGDTNIIPYMLMGERFANLIIDDKRKGRAILETICGDVTFGDLKGDYSLIKEDLAKYSIDMLKERYKNTLKPMKERLVEIDSLVDAKEHEIVQYNLTSFEKIKLEIEQKEKEIEQCDQAILDSSKAIQPLIDEKNRIMEQVNNLVLEMGAKRNAHQSRMQSTLNAIKAQIKDIDARNADIMAENKKAVEAREYDIRLLESEKNRLKTLNNRRDALLAMRDEIKEKVFSDVKCATCGQELPLDDIERLRNLFNEKKNSDLQNVVNEGKIVKEQIILCEERIANIEEIISNDIKTKELLSKEDLEKQYDDFVNAQIPFDETTECKGFVAQINGLKASIPTPSVDSNDLLAKKQNLMLELKDLNRRYGEFSIRERIELEISNLKQEKRTLGNDIARMECLIDKIKEYEEEKANIVSERINEKLKDCKFRMYSRLKSGDLVPDCVLQDLEGVPYATMNNSARLLTCLSLQRMFCEHYGIDLPIFIDEASVYDDEHLPKFDTQCIYLYASNDVEMRIEK